MAAPQGEQVAKVLLLFVAVAAFNAFQRGEIGDWFKAKFLNAGDPAPAGTASLAGLLRRGAANAAGAVSSTSAPLGSILADGLAQGTAAAEPGGLVTVDTTKMSARFASRWVPMAQAAAADGVVLSGNAYRSNATQIQLRIDHGCGGSKIYDGSCRGNPPTAVPGRSRHETGDAIDVRLTGAGGRRSPEYLWLSRNASRYGIYNLPSEPWHWSIDGK